MVIFQFGSDDMLTVNRVTAAQALKYYKEENYYTQDGSVKNSGWYGSGASKANLTGYIKDKDFENLLFAKLPDGTSIRMQKKFKKDDNKQDRAGTDLTFSAPKSVSLQAFLGGDEGLIEDHKEAVRAALDIVEHRYVATRLGGQVDRRLEYTENMIIAQFLHDTSRQTEEGVLPDPDLHTHNILFNGTEVSDGWRSVYDDLFRNRSKDIGVVYQNELARRVLARGYDIERHDNGTFDLKGFSREQIEHFSKRHLQIKSHGAKTKKQERTVVLKTRMTKNFEMERGLLWDKHRVDAAKIGVEFPVPIPDRIQSFEPKDVNDFTELAISHLSRRNVYFTKEDIETTAMSFSLGRFTTEDIQKAVYDQVGSRLIRAQSLVIDNSVDDIQGMLKKSKEDGYQDSMYSKLFELKNNSLKPVSDELRILALRERDNGSMKPIRPSEDGLLGSKHLLHLSSVNQESISRFSVVSDLQEKYLSSKIRGISGNGLSFKEFSYCINGIKSQDNYFEFLKKSYTAEVGEVWVIDKVDKIKTSYLSQILEKAEEEKARVLFLGGDERIEAIAQFKPFGKLNQEKMEDIVKTEVSNFKLKLTQEEFTTRDAQATERAILFFVEEGKQQYTPVVAKNDVSFFVEQQAQKAERETGFLLTSGQQEALGVTLTTSDQFHRWRGVAGAGKTTSMNILRQQYELKGYKVRGFAPTGDAALNLGKEAHIKDFSTIASLLTSSTTPNAADGKELWVVDEAGMLSNEDKLKLAEKANIENARVLLVGDERQNSSVGAGNPFYLSKRTDINTAHLEQSVRPRTDYMKEVFSNAIKLNAVDAIKTVDSHGKLIEIRDDDTRIDAIAEDYISSSSDSLVICKTNVEKGLITQNIRYKLATEGKLGAEKVEFTGLSPVSKTEDQLKFTFHYSENQVLVPYRNKGRLVKGEKYEIKRVRDHSLVLSNPYGTDIIVKPEDIQVQVFNKTDMSIREGDRLRWTKIHSDHYGEKRNTGAIVHVDKVNEDGSILIDAGGSKRYHLSSEDMQYFSFGYVQTVDSVQGKTTGKAIVLSDSLYDKESINVAATRAKEDLVVYTKDKNSLYPQIDHDGRNLTAHEVGEQFEKGVSTANLKNREVIEQESDFSIW